MTTGPEIWEQSGGKVDYFVAGIGTGGTVSGTGSFLKSVNPEVKVVAVEPATSRVNSGGAPGAHQITGIGPPIPTAFMQGAPVPGGGPRDMVDEFACATNDEAVVWAQKAAAQEGMMVGCRGGN